jgi:hypothetical protein
MAPSAECAIYSVFQESLASSDVFPQELKPRFYRAWNGAAEAVPLQRAIFETSLCKMAITLGRTNACNRRKIDPAFEHNVRASLSV